MFLKYLNLIQLTLYILFDEPSFFKFGKNNCVRLFILWIYDKKNLTEFKLEEYALNNKLSVQLVLIL